MLPGREGEYVERFHLAASVGSISIDSFVVSNADEPNAASIQERDASIMGMCYEEVSPMIGDVRAIHLAGIALANITAFGVIFWLLRRKSFFPAFLVCSFFLTNVLGLLPLYFGWSEVRVTQHVLDRAIVATLAWAGLAMLCLAVCGYCAASWIWSKFWRDRCCRIEVNFWTVLSIFVMIACVVLASSLPKAIEYYQAAGGGGIGASARAAFLRSLINQETFGLKSHYFRLFFLLLPLVLNFIILSKAIDRNVFLIVPILIGIQVAILLYNGEKAPVAWYLFALGYLALAKGLFRKEFIWPAFGVGAALLIVVLAGPQSMRLMADRMILGGLTVGYYVIKIFPEESPFLAGSSLRLLGMGSDVRFNLDLFMWRNIFSDSYFSHLSGTATGAVWVQGYANFGWIGAGVFAAAFGAIVASAQALVTRLFVPSVAAGVGSLLIFHYSSLGESNLDRFLTDFYLERFPD
ncbi:MAG: hypothetical protein O9352_21305 [Rhizobium sp.]|nr:hypothetical protein [Rhizobium sp.]